jgi:outer membrane protein assembly factor BamB
MKFLPLSAALLLSLTASHAQQDWPRFLGAGGAGKGKAAGLPAQFSEKDYAWKIDLPGGGVSSPIVTGGRVIVTSELGEGGRRAVLCFNLADGKEVWRAEDKFEAHGKHRFNSFASSSPASDGKNIYLAWTSGGVMRALALTLEGKKVWEKELGPYKEEHGSGASPVLAGEALIVSTDCEGGSGGILALKPADGLVLWKHDRASDRTPFSTPLTFEEKPGEWRVVVSSNPKALTCFDAKSGKVLWETENPSPGLRAVGSPAMSGGVIFAAIGQGGTAKANMAVKVADGKAEKVWEGKKAIPYVPTPLPLEGHFLFLGDGGILSSVRASDGEMLWSERVFQDQAYSSPISTGDKIYCISRSGTVAAVQADPSKFTLLGTTSLGEPCDSTPAVADGRLFIRTSKRLYCIGPAASVK